MKRRRSLLLLMLCIPFIEILAQGEVPVNMFTGTPSISIPFWTVHDHGLSATVGLAYNASGIKLEETAQFVGIGWSIVAGGSITREVRGLPDDFDGIKSALVQNGSTLDNYDDRRGWLYPRVSQSTPLANETGSFSPTSDNSTSTCSDEYSDYNKMAPLAYYNDTEPDVFYINTAGLSAAFVFDNGTTPSIRLLGIQDLKITYTKHANTHDILSFTVTRADGTIYVFGRPVIEERTATIDAGQQVTFLRNRYRLYNNQIVQSYNGNTYTGSVTYHNQWMLTKLTSPRGAQITFNYAQKVHTITEPICIGIKKSTLTTLDTKTIFTEEVKTKHQVISSVVTSTGERLEFNYNGLLISNVRVFDNRRPNFFVKEFILNHETIVASSIYIRYFLESIEERSLCEKTPPYKFLYNNVDMVAGSSSLPVPTSSQKDFWGYYNGKSNGSLFPKLYVYPALDYPDKVRVDRITGYTGEEIVLDGADRTSDATAIKVGTLNSITYPSGGTLTVDFEPHKYFDASANQSFTGGGLRVKSLTYYDGLNTASNIVNEYSYEDSPGVSSGRLLMKPVFYIPSQQYTSADGTVTKSYATLAALSSTDVWGHLLARTEENVAPEDMIAGSQVAYGKVTVKRSGSGSAVYEFNLPAAFNSAATGDWSPTASKFIRSTNFCETMGILATNGAWRFPFTRNPNYYHERGLLLNEYEYSEAGTLVRKVSNTYQYLYKGTATAPAKVWGLTIENFPNSTAVFLFGKYFLLTEMAKVLSTTTTYNYRPDNSSLSSTTEYFYQSANHKYLTKTRVTNSDGTTYSTKLKYPLDYATVTGTADQQSQMIGFMQTNGRNATPIEVIKTMQKPSQSETVIGASLTKFKTYSSTEPLPYQSLQLSTASPLADFQESTIATGTSATFTNDSRYETTAEVKAYDQFSAPVQTEDPITRSTSSVALGYNRSFPVAQFSDAAPDQVAFSDFETTTDIDFQRSADIFGSGRTGSNSIHGSVLLSRTIAKASTNTYILSFWAKTNATLGVRVVIKNTSLTVLYDNTISVPNTASKFSYIESKISVTSLPATFILEVQGQLSAGTYTSSSGLMPVLDGVAFYPVEATITSTTYDVPYGPTSVTDPAGKTVFATYDNLGRKKYTFDQDKNLLQKTSYSFSSITDQLSSSYSIPQAEFAPPIDRIPVESGTPVVLVAHENCHDNVTYEWDFGSGYVAGGREATHTFTGEGGMVAKLRVSSPGLPTAEFSNGEVTVVQSVNICAKGTKEYNALTGQVVLHHSCNDISGSPPDGQTSFKLTDDLVTLYDDDGPVPVINWKFRDIGSDTWETVLGNNTYTYYVSGIADLSAGFEVRCELYDSTYGLVGVSNTIQVAITN